MLSPLPSVGDRQLRYLDCSFSTKHNSAAHSSASFCYLLLIGLGQLPPLPTRFGITSAAKISMSATSDSMSPPIGALVEVKWIMR